MKKRAPLTAHFFRKSLVGLLLTVVTGICSAGPTVLSTNAISDAFVTTGSDGSLSGDNFGAAGALALSAPGLPQGEFQTVLQFNLSGITSSLNAIYGTGLWTVQSVSLQLTASPHNNAIFNNISAGNFNISLMQNNSWAEGTGTGGTPTTDGISFNSLQSTYINNAADQALGTFSFGGGSSGTASYSLNLTSDLLSDLRNGDNASLRLSAADDEVSYLFTARTAGGTSTRPTLVITVVPEPSCMALVFMGLATFSLWRIKKNARKREQKAF